MSILVDKSTKVLVQGATGKEGQRAIKQMLAYGTNVLVGVTPGKGGQEVESVPIFNSVEEALNKFPDVNTSFIAVPKQASKDAIVESAAHKIGLINVLTEHMPIADAAYAVAFSKDTGVKMVGPSSIGIISPGKAKLGSIGGDNPDFSFFPGNIGVISKSGGMASEVSFILKKSGYGQSTVIGMGGDMIVGSTFADLLLEFEEDRETAAVVLFGEVGGSYEEKAAEVIKSKKFTKPAVAFISGIFAETMPSGTALGHAGAIIEAGKGSREGKIKALEAAGVKIAEVPDDLPAILKKLLSKG
ncbi:MAG: succinate--CoA ligase subunit alpha [Candidatus Woykebacteria bacterium]